MKTIVESASSILQYPLQSTLNGLPLENACVKILINNKNKSLMNNGKNIERHRQDYNNEWHQHTLQNHLQRSLMKKKPIDTVILTYICVFWAHQYILVAIVY